MKIAVVCFNIKWQAGGTRLIYELAHGLMQEGHKVTIYAPEENPNAFPELRKKISIQVVPAHGELFSSKKSGGILKSIFAKLTQEKLQNLLAKDIATVMDGDFDIVNLHDFAYKVAPHYRKKNPRAKIIWTENDPPYMYLPKSHIILNILSQIFNVLKDTRERAFFRAIDGVVVLDRYNQHWCELRGLSAQIIRSGVDFETFYHSAHLHPGSKEVFRIVSLGALNPYRRYEDIIDAITILRAQGYRVNADIICKNIWQEDAYRVALLKRVAQKDIQKNVRFFFEGVSDYELMNLFAQSHAFVLATHLPPPRNGYGWGLVNFEAMAAGLPLIICETSTATEVLQNGTHALFIKPRDPEDLAKKIAFLIDHPDQYEAIARNGQSYVQEHISWKKYAQDLISLFKN